MEPLKTKDQVSQDRWVQAQNWERDFWIQTQLARAKYGKNWIWRLLALFGAVSKHRGDDWNEWWQTQFNHYDFLPAEVGNALEAGCGPYTNIRLIQSRCQPRHLVLSDPLIRTYVRFKLTFVSEMYRKAACMLDDHPLEELPFADEYFDLSVMINVLDHVRDARRCMHHLIRVTKPGGILIIGQDLTNEEDLEQARTRKEDVGHPIKLDAPWFEPFLKRGFEPMIYRILPRSEGRAPDFHYGTLLFAGRKQQTA